MSSSLAACRRQGAVALAALVCLALLAGCRSETVPEEDGPAPPLPDLQVDRSAPGPDGPARDAARADAAPAALRAEDYCERVVDSFCAFYLRCGRTVTTSLAECRARSLETCNALYEPFYVALVKAGLLQLSSKAVSACESHLEQVACEQQLHDLDGPCAMWTGTQPAGKPCGIGIESLVCDGQSACAVSLSLCGTCKPLAQPGGACGAGEVSCGSQATCLDKTCQLRVSVGGSCGSTTPPCVIGASCQAGKCVGPTWVGLTEACDSSHRCRSGLRCVGGSCRAEKLLGEPCGADAPCAAGRCVASKCEPLLATGQPCQSGSECVSSRCVQKLCGAIPGECF